MRLGRRPYPQPRQVQAPTLVLQGSQDQTVRTGDTQKLLRRLPAALGIRTAGADVADAINFSLFHFSHTFNKIVHHTPYDYLIAALGACTSMTLRIYADRKGWPLERTAVALRHQKIHAEDCKTCEEKEGKIDRIDRWITLTGPLDGEQRARLMEIADKCPVHRTLTGTIEIITREEGGQAKA